MDNYFTFFRQLTLLRVDNIQVTRVLSKNMLRKCTIIRDQQLRKKRKKNIATLNSIDQAKKPCNFDSVWLVRQQDGILSFFCILWTQEIYSVLE